MTLAPTPQLWTPTASIRTLRTRAALLARVRGFFAARGVLEVDTPLLSSCTVTDPYITSIEVKVGGRTAFLQSSPEYFMKRLLAAGSGPIFQLGHAFRDDPRGPLHAPEFTMLEWYRPGFDHRALMAEIAELLAELAPRLPIEVVDYADVFKRETGLDPHTAQLSALLSACTQGAHLHHAAAKSLSRSACLDLLFSLLVQPRLGVGVCLVSEYPVCQAALAQVRRDGHAAERFEIFINAVEVGNGYHELDDAGEQMSRMRDDNIERERLGLEPMRIDVNLLEALEHGIGNVAGVAIGVERLLGALLGHPDIAAVSAFGHAHAVPANQ